MSNMEMTPRVAAVGPATSVDGTNQSKELGCLKADPELTSLHPTKLLVRALRSIARRYDRRDIATGLIVAMSGRHR